VAAAIGDDADLLQETQQRFQHETDPWFRKSWFANHARTKPRGFPGDFEMLAVMYDRTVRSRGFGGYLDFRLLDLTLGHAVPARLRIAREFLIAELSSRRGDVSILDVACGPCREYLHGLPHPHDCRVHVTCVDNDREALEYVAANVVPTAPEIAEFKFVRHNALRMISAKANIRHFGRSDIMYSVGLADYIPDRHLVPMLQAWRESLHPGGVLYVAFKDIDRYDKTPYEWFLDWHFLRRTEADCRRLFHEAGFDPARIEMNRDETGVIMNFVHRLAKAPIVRVDLPADETQPAARPLTTPHGRQPGRRKVEAKT
jgi:SAM-dependent methyltransferase